MLDYLLRFDTEDAAKEALTESGLWTGEAWDGSRVIAPITIIMLDGSVPSGWWCGVTLTAVSDADKAVAAMAQAALDPAKEVGLAPHEYAVQSAWPHEAIDAIAQISPLWVGRPYRFPGLPVDENADGM